MNHHWIAWVSLIYIALRIVDVSALPTSDRNRVGDVTARFYPNRHPLVFDLYRYPKRACTITRSALPRLPTPGMSRSTLDAKIDNKYRSCHTYPIALVVSHHTTYIVKTLLFRTFNRAEPTCDMIPATTPHPTFPTLSSDHLEIYVAWGGVAVHPLRDTGYSRISSCRV